MEGGAPKNISVGIRLASMLLDHFFMCMLSLLVMAPVLAFLPSEALAEAGFGSGKMGVAFYIMSAAFAVYCCKDSFNGRSLAKHLLKLQVVDRKIALPASPLQCVTRNLFIILWPVEVFVTLLNPSRRIGDRVAGTEVRYFDVQTVAPAKIQWVKTLLAMVIAYVFMLLCFQSILWPLRKLREANAVHCVAGSYNDVESKRLEEAIKRRMGAYMEPGVRVFDSIEGASLKYVGITCRMHKKFDDYALRREQLLQLVYATYPAHTFTGHLQFKYQASMRMHPSVESIGILPLEIKRNK